MLDVIHWEEQGDWGREWSLGIQNEFKDLPVWEVFYQSETENWKRSRTCERSKEIFPVRSEEVLDRIVIKESSLNGMRRYDRENSVSD